MIVRMFEGVDEAGLVATIEASTRTEAQAGAQRAAAIGELVSRRIGDDGDDPRAWWVCDVWDSTAAEIAAAMNISHRKASGQMRIAETLRDHLPKVAELFRQGRLSARVISAITWRTRLIADDQVWALIDTELAQRALQWGPLSEDKLVAAVDALVYRFDPAAVIVSRATARSRDFIVGDYEDDAGLTSVRGKLLGPHAAVLNQRVAAMVAGVCEHDPRSAGERRSDALGAIANGNDHLRCACGSPACPANADQPAPKSSVVINVIADQTAIDAAQDTIDAAQTSEPAATSAKVAPAQSSTPARRQDAGTAIVSGREMLPTPMLAELLRSGAKLQPLCDPDEEPEARYRPSAKLARYVRARDLTCRFPGCTMPAEFCDIDHVVPYPVGPTHPSNLACLCRKHHHLKTFWAGDWALMLHADGTAIWTSPTGCTYTTHPGCRTFFPDWDPTTAELPPPPADAPPATERGLRIPKRTHLRSTERAKRIKAERAQNTSDPPPNSADPPPF